jgi:hypothetical protein
MPRCRRNACSQPVYTQHTPAMCIGAHAYQHTHAQNQHQQPADGPRTNQLFAGMAPAQRNPENALNSRSLHPTTHQTSRPASQQTATPQSDVHIARGWGVSDTRPVSFSCGKQPQSGVRCRAKPTRFKPQRVYSTQHTPNLMPAASIWCLVQPHSWQSMLQLCPYQTTTTF